MFLLTFQEQAFPQTNILIFLLSNKWGYKNENILQDKTFINISRGVMAHSAVTGFLVKSITIWSPLLWYWPKLYELFVILINAQFILSPHLLFPSVWQNLSEWKCKCFAIYILFSTRSIYWYKTISSGRHLEPARFYYGLGIGIFVIGPINHCNRWELTNTNLASYPTLPSYVCNFQTFCTTRWKLKQMCFSVSFVYKLMFIVLYITREVI